MPGRPAWPAIRRDQCRRKTTGGIPAGGSVGWAPGSRPIRTRAWLQAAPTIDANPHPEPRNNRTAAAFGSCPKRWPNVGHQAHKRVRLCLNARHYRT